MQWLRNKKGQNTLEYVVVISAVVVALIAMQHYVKRAIQGRLRTAADRIGEGQLYEPGKIKAESFTRTTVNREVKTEIKPDVEIEVYGENGELEKGHGTLRTDTIIKDETIRKSEETVAEFGPSLW